jgi:glycosyltransferase involved in cell wall biosynthesis
MSAASIELIVRTDAERKRGGDVVQAEEYARELTALGRNVRIAPFDAHAAASVAPVAQHFFNVDRPFEFLEFAAGRTDHFVSPIHHAFSDVRAMRRGERSADLRGAVSRLPEGLREYLAYVHRTVRDERAGPAERLGLLLRAGRRLPGVHRRVGAALDAAAAVFVLGVRESEALQTDYGWSRRNEVVAPNGADSIPATVPWRDRVPRILVVGRVEPRKRQLDILAAADREGVAVTFVGAANPNAGEYAARFRAAAARSPHSEWLGAVDRAQVLDLMQHSRVLLNFSWAEVQSLVDLEAAAAGCWVVANRTGATAEWLGDGVVTFERDALVEAVREARRRSTAEAGPAALAYDWTWQRTAGVLAEAYDRSR